MIETVEQFRATVVADPAARKALARVRRACKYPDFWMQHCTKTKDEQDSEHTFKPFPDREYFRYLTHMANTNPVLAVEKSRTMMVTWWASGYCLHHIMTHPGARAIFWAQDERRALKLREYAWVLWEQQDPALKDLFPVLRPKERQSFDRIELRDGGIGLAIPGKDPDVIRSEHPSIVMMDEACFIENGAEAFDVAISSRVPKVLVVSSAAPSWFRILTKDAVPVNE